MRARPSGAPPLDQARTAGPRNLDDEPKKWVIYCCTIIMELARLAITICFEARSLALVLGEKLAALLCGRSAWPPPIVSLVSNKCAGAGALRPRRHNGHLSAGPAMQMRPNHRHTFAGLSAAVPLRAATESRALNHNRSLSIDSLAIRLNGPGM